jgi:hypothetical protein
MWLFWLTMAVSVLAVIVSLVFATRRGIQLFRDTKKLTAATGEALDRVTRSSEEIERHLELAAESGTRLDASLERLRVSRGRLNVQRAAIADVRGLLGQITGLAPRK